MEGSESAVKAAGVVPKRRNVDTADVKFHFFNCLKNPLEAGGMIWAKQLQAALFQKVRIKVVSCFLRYRNLLYTMSGVYEANKRDPWAL